MSTQELQQIAETKPRTMTGYIHYGESDNLTKLFDILNEFRKNNGLKYSHQPKASMVFFNVSSEHLTAFFSVRPFKISRFQTKSEYKCEKETSEQLIAQKDSFLRILWDDNTGVLTFLSRTPSRVHGNLVRRIFKDSGVEFQRDSYAVLRNNFVRRIDESQENGDVDEDMDEQEINTQVQTQTSLTQFLVETPKGFQKVDYKRTRKPRETSNATGSSQPQKTVSRVVKETDTESKPKVRGAKFTRAPKVN